MSLTKLCNAIRLMGTPVNILMKSDGALALDVSNIQASKVKKYPGLPRKMKIVPATGIDGSLELRPIQAMLELARGTALRCNPLVLVWPALRYLGVFTKDGMSALRLDAAATRFIGPHQRCGLSEELGIGFGILVAKHWCMERVPGLHFSRAINVMDVDKAIGKGSVPNLQKVGRRQPDYLLAYQNPADTPGKITYDLLETKGTVDESGVKKQLGRAVTQLAGLQLGGQPMTGIAVSTVSNENKILAKAVDPDENPFTWTPTDEVLRRWRAREAHLPAKGGAAISASSDLLPENEEFLATATNADNAALAAFGGLRKTAEKWLPTLPAIGETDAETSRELDIGEFVGTECVIRVSDAEVRVYQGVEKQVAGALRDLKYSGVVEAQQEFTESIEKLPAPAGTNNSTFTALASKVIMSEPSSDLSVAALSPDGSMLQICIKSV